MIIGLLMVLLLLLLMVMLPPPAHVMLLLLPLLLPSNGVGDDMANGSKEHPLFSILSTTLMRSWKLTTVSGLDEEDAALLVSKLDEEYALGMCERRRMFIEAMAAFSGGDCA